MAISKPIAQLRTIKKPMGDRRYVTEGTASTDKKAANVSKQRPENTTSVTATVAGSSISALLNRTDLQPRMISGTFDLPLLRANGAAHMAERHLIPRPLPELETIKQCFPKRKVFKNSRRRDNSNDSARKKDKKQHKFFVPLSPRTIVFTKDLDRD